MEIDRDRQAKIVRSLLEATKELDGEFQSGWGEEIADGEELLAFLTEAKHPRLVHGDVVIEMPACTVSSYRVIAEKHDGPVGIVQKEPVGEPVVVATSGAPKHLRDAIDELVKQYCNH